MTISECLHQFFTQYLTRMKGVSLNTIKAYEQTLRLFLAYAGQSRSVKIRVLEIDHISPDLVLDFLDHLETTRRNSTRTRNHRLAAFKSLARMIRLVSPEHKGVAERLLSIPQKRFQRRLIGFLTPDEAQSVFNAVELKTREGFRDYTILHLLYDTGARAGEAAGLNLDYYDSKEKTMAILGKGNRYRLIEIQTRTAELLDRYIADYRKPKAGWNHRLFINQCGEGLTRHGIHRICKNHLTKVLPAKRMKDLNPAHSFRHTCAMNMLSSGASITEVKNHLGHESIQSTMLYLNLNMQRKREIANKHRQYMQTAIIEDPKINDLIDWENKQKILEWLDSL